MEKKKKVRIVFKNPCRYCLTRPMCKKDCEDFKDYESTQENIAFILSLTILVTLIVLTCILFLFIDFNITIKICLLVLIFEGIYFYYTKKLIDESFSEFKEIKWYFKILILIMNPWDEIVNSAVDKFKLNDKLTNFIHRYRN